MSDWKNGDACEVRIMGGEMRPAWYVGPCPNSPGVHVIRTTEDKVFMGVRDGELSPPAPPEPVKVERWLRAQKVAPNTIIVVPEERNDAREVDAHVTLLLHPDGRTELDTETYRRAGAIEALEGLRKKGGVSFLHTDYIDRMLAELRKGGDSDGPG